MWSSGPCQGRGVLMSVSQASQVNLPADKARAPHIFYGGDACYVKSQLIRLQATSPLMESSALRWASVHLSRDLRLWSDSRVPEYFLNI